MFFFKLRLSSFKPLSAVWFFPTLLGAFLLYANLNRGLLQYDEADYAAAARQGLWANYVDATAMSFAAFVRKGVQDALIGGHEDFSKEVRKQGDVAFYRHYHPPLTFYALAIAERTFGPADRVFRLTAWLMAALIVPTVYWSVRTTWKESGVGCAFAAALLTAVSPMMDVTSATVSIHPPYILVALITLTLLVRYFRSGALRNFYWFCSALSLAFLASEYALFLLCACLAGFLLISNPLFSVDRAGVRASHHLVGGIAVFVLVFVLLWPGALLKLSVLKGYLFQAYVVFVKKSLAYGDQDIVRVWLSRFAADPVGSCLLLVGAGYGAYGFFTRTIDKTLLPIYLYPTAIFCANLLNRAAFNTYAMSMYPFLFMFAAAWLWRWTNRLSTTGVRRVTIVGGLAAVMVVNVVLEKLERPEDTAELAAVIHTLETVAAPVDSVLVSHGLLATASYYLPAFEVHTLYLEDTLTATAEKLDQKIYRYFLFSGTEAELETASYRPSLETGYRQVARRTNRTGKVVCLFGRVGG